MRLFAVALLIFLQGFAGSAALAEALGTVKLRIGGSRYSMTIPDHTGGTDSYWAVGPVSILALGPQGGTLRLTFDENGKGLASGVTIELRDKDGNLWVEGDVESTVTLTRAANIPPDFGIAGTFDAKLGQNGTTAEISGSFKAVLPRQDFAPTPRSN